MNRRPGVFAGRRFAFALATALAAVACLAGGAAAADQPVVTATIYPGTTGSIRAQTASLSTLNGCTPYSGAANPLYLYNGHSSEGGQPFQLPDSTWPLSTVLACGLGVPLTDLTNVQVVRSPASRGLEDPLTSTQLTDPGQWQEVGALPVISVDGSEDQTTYTRPYKGGSDNNSADQVVVQGQPIAIAVYESGPPLTVTASAKTLSQTATAMKVKLTATVRDASGAIPSSSLTWSWSFGDGGRSSATSPTHAFAPGTYPVTVQVADAGAGTGGADTIQVQARSSGKGAGSSNHGGGGRHSKSRSPVGPDHSNGTHPGAGAGSGKGSGTGGGVHGSGTSNGAAAGPSGGSDTHGRQGSASNHADRAGGQPAGRQSNASAAASTTSTTTASRPSPSPRPAHHNPARPHQPTIAASAPVVRGRLISDVTPLSPAASALVHDTSPSRSAAPQVRQATEVSTLPIVLGVLAVVGLLALGAGRELRGRGGRRALRAGS